MTAVRVGAGGPPRRCCQPPSVGTSWVPVVCSSQPQVTPLSTSSARAVGVWVEWLLGSVALASAAWCRVPSDWPPPFAFALNCGLAPGGSLRFSRRRRPPSAPLGVPPQAGDWPSWTFLSHFHPAFLPWPFGQGRTPAASPSSPPPLVPLTRVVPSNIQAHLTTSWDQPLLGSLAGAGTAPVHPRGSLSSTCEGHVDTGASPSAPGAGVACRSGPWGWN